MAVTKIESWEYTCDFAGCPNSCKSSVGRPPSWGLVMVYDGKYDHTTIGDQNGWNHYDACPMHYERFMTSLGIAKHNIVLPVPDEG